MRLYDGRMNQALQNVLSTLEPHALTFCTETEWNDVKTDVLVAGSVSKATKTSQQVLQKAVALRQFGSRSDAARYAATVRWNTAPQNRQESTGFNWKSPMPSKPKEPISDASKIDDGTVGNIGAGKKALEKITEMSASKKPGFGISRADKKLMTMGAKQVVRAKNFGEAIDAMHQMRTEGGENRGLLRLRGAAKVALARFNFKHPETADVQTWPTVATVKAVDAGDAIVDEVEKARARAFASRSEAARYAASIRWQNARGQGGANAGAGGAQPPETGASGAQPSRAASEREAVQQERERLGQMAVDAERERRETAQAEQEETGLGVVVASGYSSGIEYKPVSAEPATPEQMKAFASKGQVGSGNRLQEWTGDSGDKYLMDETKGFAIRRMGGALAVNPKLKPGVGYDGTSDEFKANVGNSIGKVFNLQQERVAGLSSAEFKAATVKPVGIMQQVDTRSRTRKTPDVTDLLVLDRDGASVAVPARKFALAAKIFPDATPVVPVPGQNINFVDRSGTVVATVMPMRLTAPPPAEFQQRASAMLAQQAPAE